MKNLGLKIASVFIAILLFSFVHSETHLTEISFFAPVEISNIPKDKTIIWPNNRQAQITVSGPSFVVSRVAASPPSFKVRIPSDVGNRHVAILQPNSLSLPPSVQVKNVSPPELELIFDRVISKTVPVDVQQIGSLDENLRLNDFSISPSEVVITGPETEVEGVTSVQGYPVDLRDLAEDTVKVVPIRVPGRLTEVSATEVEVEVLISSVEVEREFESLPIEIRAVRGGSYIVEPQEVNIKVRGPQALIDNLKSESFIPYVRIDKEQDFGNGVSVSVEVPRGISVIETQPERVAVSEAS